MPDSPLLSLPEELLCAIAGFVHVDSIVNFSLACTATLRCVRDRLETNQGYHAQHYLRHDRQPLTAPTLLRLAIANPEAAWHIRALEYWDFRPGWHKWKPWSFTWGNPGGFDDNEAGEDWPEPAEDHSALGKPLDSFFDIHEIYRYVDVMREQFYMNDGDMNDWMQRVREGWDEPLKGMLMALPPKLDRVNFIQYHSWQSNVYHDLHPLGFLAQAITSIVRTGGAVWPPGFMSLRQVSVCTSTSLRHPGDFYTHSYTPTPSEVAPLFFLPNIKALNFTLLGCSDDLSKHYPLPARCSSVEELAFSLCDLTITEITKLIKASRNLRRLVCIKSCEDATTLTEILAESYCDSLEILVFEGHDDETFSPRILRRFGKLRRVEGIRIIDLLGPRGSTNGEEGSAENSQLPA